MGSRRAGSFHGSGSRHTGEDDEAEVHLAWFVDTEPTFTPLMPPEVYGEAIPSAKKIIQPHK